MNYQETKALIERVDKICKTHNVTDEDLKQDIFVAAIEGKSDIYISGIIAGKNNNNSYDSRVNDLLNTIYNSTKTAEKKLDETKKANNTVNEKKVTSHNENCKNCDDKKEYFKRTLDKNLTPEEFNFIVNLFGLDYPEDEKHPNHCTYCGKCYEHDDQIDEEQLLNIIKKLYRPLSFFLYL
jgi:DNA-directed RNA polymerase subunit M/transcription elongation factor TFIIS